MQIGQCTNTGNRELRLKTGSNVSRTTVHDYAGDNSAMHRKQARHRTSRSEDIALSSAFDTCPQALPYVHEHWRLGMVMRIYTSRIARVISGSYVEI